MTFKIFVIFSFLLVFFSSAVYSVEICTYYEVQEEDWSGVHSGDFVKINRYKWACSPEAEGAEEVSVEVIQPLSFFIKKVDQNGTILENREELIQIVIKNKKGSKDHWKRQLILMIR